MARKRVYTFKELEGMRENSVVFNWFFDNIVPIVIGKKNYDRLHSRKLVSNWVPVSVEAYGMMCVDNYHDRVFDMCFKEEHEVKRDNKYTTVLNKKKRVNQGWGNEGPELYNQLVATIERGRHQAISRGIEEIYYKEKRGIREEKERKVEEARQRKRVELESGVKKTKWMGLGSETSFAANLYDSDCEVEEDNIVPVQL